MEEYRSTAEEALAKERVTHDKNIADLMRNNNHIMKRTAKHVAQVPHSLRVRSAAIAQAREAEGRVREEMIKARDALVADMKRGQLLELENMKQQYEFLAKKKTEEQDKLVEDFNNYHKRKTLQLNEYKDGSSSSINTAARCRQWWKRWKITHIYSKHTHWRPHVCDSSEDRPREIFKDPARLASSRAAQDLAQRRQEPQGDGKLGPPKAGVSEVTAAAAHRPRQRCSVEPPS